MGVGSRCVSAGFFLCQNGPQRRRSALQSLTCALDREEWRPMWQRILPLLACLSLLGANAARANDSFSLDSFVEKTCVRCHGEKEPKGKLQLKGVPLQDHPELAQKVLEALESGEMPPKKAEQPSPQDRRRAVASLKASVAQYLRTQGRLRSVTMRRMNRFEYNNAVRDLLKLRGDIYPLPEKCIRADRPYFDPASGRFPDEIRVGNRPLGKFQVERQILTGVVPFAIDLQSEHGFNNRGDELSLSPILLESFLRLGRSIVDSPQFPGYCRIFKELFEAQPDEQRGVALRSRLRALLSRAFREPVDDESVERYAKFFEARLDESGSYTVAMKNVVAAVLSSPRFLYLSERTRGVGGVEALDDFELATRLSFFIWSSIPDEDLLALAKGKELSRPEVLESQVRRMLRDPRSKSLAENFARQWLRLDRLITAVPDIKRFPAYYSRIGCEYWKFGLQMMIEPLLLFESILVEDRSVLLLVDSDYSYRSDELQHWYDSANPFGNKRESNRFNTNQQVFKRRQLSTRREGGVITSAATLTMNSSPLRTSPIRRGAWVATVIFNRPPPPPPDDIPEIEEDDAAIEATGKTLRDRLEAHRLNASCAGCHAKIDPLGFVLENYDAVGRWRDKYRSGLPVDASGKLAFTPPFQDVVEFKDAILARKREFLRAYCEHLLSYALGRGLAFEDRVTIDTIVERVEANGGRFSTTILEVVKSRPFLHKTNEKAKE